MKVLLILKLKYAIIEKPCNNYAEALKYTKLFDDVCSYEIKPSGEF